MRVFRFGDYTKYPEEPTVGAAWYPENVRQLPSQLVANLAHGSH